MVVLVGMLAGVAFVLLNRMVADAIQTTGTDMLGARVEVGRVVIAPWSGKGRIERVVVHNPPGFNAERLFEVAEGSLHLHLPSLFSDEIVVEAIHIDGAHLTVEQALLRNNLRVLMQNMEAFESSDEPLPRLRIHTINITDTRATLYAGRVAEHAFTVPDVHLQNIGTDVATEAGDALAQLIEPLIRQTLAAAARNGWSGGGWLDRWRPGMSVPTDTTRAGLE